jgi:hypothetical protein
MSEAESRPEGFRCDLCGRTFDTEQGRSLHQTTGHDDAKPYTDADRLRSLYWDEELSIRQIADQLGTDKDRIAYWLTVHDIETRRSYADQQFATLRIDKDGYLLWREYHDGTRNRVLVHRLVAVAEYGFDAVADNDVHHKNGVQFDNRPSNLEPLDPSEHRRIHGLERADEQRQLMDDLRESGRLDPDRSADTSEATEAHD